MKQRSFKTALLTLGTLCAVLSAAMLLHSLRGGTLIGCGAGSGCDSVMGTRWGYILGSVPVSLPALASYIILIACAAALGTNESLERTVRILLLVLGGCFAGCALWFGWLQAGVLHTFCRYCTLLHLLGVAAAVLILAGTPRSFRPNRFLCLLAGLLLALVFAAVQVRTAPEVVYDKGRTESSLPSFSSDEVYTIGPADAQKTVTLLFDFQCSHCRKIHPLLPEAAARAGVRIQMCPVPLSADCNPYIPDGIDRFKGSCAITRQALAIWLSDRENYPDFEAGLMDGSVVADEAIDAQRMKDPRIDDYLERVFELFGRTSSKEKSGIPRFIYKDSWVVPETDSVDGLVEVLEALTGN